MVESSGDLVVEVGPTIRAKIISTFLVQSTGFIFAHVLASSTEGTLFYINDGDQFLLWALVAGEQLHFRRNAVTLSVDLADSSDYMLELLWSPERLEVSVSDRFGTRWDEADTPFTLPTARLVSWARARAIVERTKPYETDEDVLEEILTQLRSLQRRLDEGAWHGFWDGDEPKPEPKMTQIIHSHIVDALEINKGIRVFPELQSGPGRMDFLFTATRADRVEVQVCCEFKLAHSDKLVDGVVQQLPEYMARRCTDHGIYVVLDCGYDPVVSFPLKNWQDPKVGILDAQFQLFATQRKIHPLLVKVHAPDKPSGGKRRRRSRLTRVGT